MKKYSTFFQQADDTNSNFCKVTILIFILVLFSVEFMSAQSGPEIDIWYGDNQPFGQYGTPQRWVNIQGNVSDPDGINSFYYTLNGGSAIDLSIGADGRRLLSSGDFTVDLDVKDLVVGDNTVLITAIDGQSNQSQYAVTIDFDNNNIWPIPYDINWQTTTSINDVAHVVDGEWEITTSGLRTIAPGYDRLVAIGDTAWGDYEVTVPVTIHSSMSSSHGVGILLRWMGHTDWGATCAQPKCGWLPLGAICWYRGNRLEIYGNEGTILATQSRNLTIGTTYMFKARVETNPGIGGLYSFKVWEQGTAEPTGWDITGQEALSDPQNGSMMLISHHGDVTFGNVNVTSIPISIQNIQATVHSGNTSATISWNTNVPASSRVDYGNNDTYSLGYVEDVTLKTSHSLELTGLTPDTEYNYQVTSESVEGDVAVSGDKTFTTVSSNIISDDFHLPLLNESVWTFVDPLEDCSYDLVGSNTEDAWLNISVPAGQEHQVWDYGVTVPHIRQDCNNADFEVEVKFESSVVTPQYQEQGILVRQDDDTYLRFEFFSKNEGTIAYAASFTSSGHSVHSNQSVYPLGTAPLYMRVKRETDQWTMTYSNDGSTWNQAALFIFEMNTVTIGPYAGNALGNNSPAHTASIDYFINTDSPIDPEDPVGDIVVITSAPITEANVGQLYSYDVEANGDPAPTFSLLTAPTGMTIDENTGLIEWMPGSSGDFDVSVQASNTIPSVDIQDFVIHVFDNNLTGGPVSDDFNDPILDGAVWSFIDPQDDGGFYEMTGTCMENAWVNISVPGGSDHEIWDEGILAPHILQECVDTDFELEVKFESSLSGGSQEQGILIKGDDTNFLRFEFYSNPAATDMYVLAATFEPGPTIFPLTADLIYYQGSIGSADISPIYMRVNRTGNQWTQSYSFDGINWTSKPTFTHSLEVSAVGTYAGNYGSSPPAHISSVDYFFFIVAPISPEDRPCTDWVGAIDSDWENDDNWSLVSPDQSMNAIIPDVSAASNIFPEINEFAECSNLMIESGATLNIGTDGSLTIHGIFLNDGETTIHSDEVGTGSLIDNGFIVGTGNTNVERYLLQNKWHYISAPVDDPLAEVLLGIYMMQWDEPSEVWSYIVDPGYLMETDMQGFAIWSEEGMTGNTTVTFTGDLNSGEKSFTLFHTPGSPPEPEPDPQVDYTGFNFTGNPYPSAVNWNVDDGMGWTRTNMDPTIYVWNPNILNYGAYVKDGIDGTNGVDSIIPSQQGFFVLCSDPAGGTIGLDNRARVHNSKEILKEQAISSQPILKLKVSGNGYTDEILFIVDPQSTFMFDSELDAFKLRGNALAPQLYSFSDDNRELSINTIPIPEEGKTIPLGLEVGTETIYSISAPVFMGFEPDMDIYLEDIKENTFTRINPGIFYNFSAHPLEDNQRFYLHFAAPNDIVKELQFSTHIFSAYGNIYIQLPDTKPADIAIFDLMGRLVANQKSSGEKLLEVSLDNPAGYFLVRVITGKQLVTRKVFVN